MPRLQLPYQPRSLQNFDYSLVLGLFQAPGLRIHNMILCTHFQGVCGAVRATDFCLLTSAYSESVLRLCPQLFRSCPRGAPNSARGALDIARPQLTCASSQAYCTGNFNAKTALIATGLWVALFGHISWKHLVQVCCSPMTKTFQRNQFPENSVFLIRYSIQCNTSQSLHSSSVLCRF
jgi:hypothetical protein